jgi:hypothetical protein
MKGIGICDECERIIEHEDYFLCTDCLKNTIDYDPIEERLDHWEFAAEGVFEK